MLRAWVSQPPGGAERHAAYEAELTRRSNRLIRSHRTSSNKSANSRASQLPELSFSGAHALGAENSHCSLNKISKKSARPRFPGFSVVRSRWTNQGHGTRIGNVVKGILRTRTDRLATLYFFHPLLRSFPFRAARIPILMYHSLSETERGSASSYYETVTSPRVFADQMKFLHEGGYRTISLNEAFQFVHDAGRDPAKVVVITFDDGYRDFATQGLAILRQYGFGATVFLPTAYIGDSVRKFKGRECLTWSEVREIHKAGICFGSHTVSHPQLALITPHEVEEEVRCSKQTIEDKLGSCVESFAYPYAFPEPDRRFAQRLRNVLEEAGYHNGVSTVLGTAGVRHDRYFLPRLPVNSWDDVRFFQAKVEGYYDWAHGPQYAAKMFKGITAGQTGCHRPAKVHPRFPWTGS